MSSGRLATLLAWCAVNRIQIDSRLEIIDHDGFSVYSRDESIECARTLVHIPKTAVLSVNACFLSQHIASVPWGHGAHLSLALALYGELLRGTHSPWFGYLQSLPRETVDIAMFWGLDNVIETRKCTCSPRGCCNTNDASAATDNHQQQISHSQCPSCVWLHDNKNAREWLQVTQIDRKQVDLMEEVRQYYIDVVEPTFHAVAMKLGDAAPETNPNTFEVSFSGYCHAYALVSTRAFWVDAYHGLAMVPIADAFNHTNDNHVQMESDYDVCVECGSLAECEHDREMESTTVPPSLPSPVHPLSHDDRPTSSEVDYLEMRTVRPIPPFSEVFNTYGSLPNAALLSRYGFTLPENEYDTIRMVFDPLSTVKNLFKYYVGVEEVSVGDAVMETSRFGKFEIRNTFRPYGQGIVDNEAASASVGVDKASAGGTAIHPSEEPAWENMINRLLYVFAYVAGAWSSEATWDEEGDGLIFNPQPPLTCGPVSFRVGDATVEISHDMVVNSDGKISHNLWLFCIVIALFAARSHFDASFGDLMERVERGPEAVTRLTEFKARLINVQGYVERLGHTIHDGDSVSGHMEGGGNHGSTSPPLPHLAPLSLTLDYDTELDEFAQPATVARAQPGAAIEPGGACITAPSGSSSPHWASESRVVFPETGPQDPEINTNVAEPSSMLPRVPSISCRRMMPAKSYQETSPSSTSTRAAGFSAQRERSPSAEGERPPKRFRRRCSDPVVANLESANGLGKTTPDAAQVGGTSDEDETTHCLALLLARTVVGVCHERYRPPTVSKEERGVGMTAAELGDLVDDIRTDMPRTRSVLEMAMSERSVVESCAARWSAILGVSRGHGSLAP